MKARIATPCWSWAILALPWIFLTAGCESQEPGEDQADVVGSVWKLQEYGPLDQPQEPLAGTDITLAFGAAGAVVGSAGCNRYQGQYCLGADDSLRFGPLASTRMMCSEPAGVMEQEYAYLGALEKVRIQRQLGGNLELHTADGTKLSFRRAQTDPLSEEAAADFVARFHQTMREGNWEEWAEMLAPDSAGELQGVLVTVVEADDTGDVARKLLGIDKASELRRMPPPRAIGRAIRSILSQAPVLDGMLQAEEVEVLGSVSEDERLHLVYRKRVLVAGYPFEGVEVLTLQPHEGAWCALLPSGLEEMVCALVHRTRELKN